MLEACCCSNLFNISFSLNYLRNFYFNSKDDLMTTIQIFLTSDYRKLCMTDLSIIKWALLSRCALHIHTEHGTYLPISSEPK